MENALAPKTHLAASVSRLAAKASLSQRQGSEVYEPIPTRAETARHHTRKPYMSQVVAAPSFGQPLSNNSRLWAALHVAGQQTESHILLQST